MSDLYRRGDLNAFGMQEVSSPDGSYAYPLAAEYLDHMIEECALVPVEPVGTLTVNSRGVVTGDVWTEFEDGTVDSYLPPGNYLIVKADDE